MENHKKNTYYDSTTLVTTVTSCFPDNILRCWCFDCRTIFLADGNSPIGTAICTHCGNKNYDFDIHFIYSKQEKKSKTKQTIKSMAKKVSRVSFSLGQSSH